MRAYKKNVKIEKIGSFKKAYYNMNGDEIYCGTYMKSYTDSEIKEEIVKEISKRF